MIGDEDHKIYRVVKNDEDQYSIWAIDMDLPLGWHDQQVSGSKEECLSYINEVWIDMRPRSLREAMDAKNSTSVN